MVGDCVGEGVERLWGVGGKVEEGVGERLEVVGVERMVGMRMKVEWGGEEIVGERVEGGVRGIEEGGMGDGVE